MVIDDNSWRAKVLEYIENPTHRSLLITFKDIYDGPYEVDIEVKSKFNSKNYIVKNFISRVNLFYKTKHANIELNTNIIKE